MPDTWPSSEQIGKAAPALQKYTQAVLNEVWSRPGLNRRDRSLVTLAVFVARNQTEPLPWIVGQALDHGVKPGEISETITHLAFYSGWANAAAALAPVQTVFSQRGIATDHLSPVSPTPLPLNEAAENERATRVAAMFDAVSASLVKDTTDFLFRDLWLRPGLAPRDRSLVTVSSLIANGQSAQLSSHLGIGMNNGLTKVEIGEIISHTAFYAGWPHGFSAMTVAKGVFEARPK